MALIKSFRQILAAGQNYLRYKLIYDELSALEERINDVEGGVVAAGSIGTAELSNDAANADKVKVVVREVTVEGEATTGEVTNAADIGGVLLGVIPGSGVGSAIKAMSLDAAGKITVELTTAQGSGTDATINVVVLQK